MLGQQRPVLPTLGWIPLFMVLFGIDDGLEMAVIIKAVIVPVALNLLQALASVPGWFTGVYLALSQAWISLIVVELLASSQGSGYLMVSSEKHR